MRETGNEVSRENVELVRRLYAELASEGSTQEFVQRLTDDALGRFLDQDIEWVPVTHSLLAVDSYGRASVLGRVPLDLGQLQGRAVEVVRRR